MRSLNKIMSNQNSATGKEGGEEGPTTGRGLPVRIRMSAISVHNECALRIQLIEFIEFCRAPFDLLHGELTLEGASFSDRESLRMWR